MATLESIRRALSGAMPALRGKYHVAGLALFGSWVRGEATAASDVDILVEFAPEATVGFFEFMALEQELSELLGMGVDLVTKGALKPVIGRRVLAELLSV